MATDKAVSFWTMPPFREGGRVTQRELVSSYRVYLASKWKTVSLLSKFGVVASLKTRKKCSSIAISQIFRGNSTERKLLIIN